MTRKIIPNVEKLYENPAENYMFPSCMRSAMWALGEEKTLDFLYFAGVCGDLFTQSWYTKKWSYNNEYSARVWDTQEPLGAAFNACGYEYEFISREEIRKNCAKYIEKIIVSIDNGVPVLTFGIVGPPTCSIIFGYDEGGETLIGWSQFTDEPKPDNPHDLYCSENYFQVKNGLDKSEALIFIGNKKSSPDIAGSIRQSIYNIPKFATIPAEEHIVFGRAAFEAWADSLLDDTCFNTESDLGSPLDTYGSCIVQIGTNMYYVQEYLHRTLELCPDMTPLIHELENAYQRVKNALKKVTDFQGGYFFEADRTALLRRDFRETLAGLIRELGVCYTDAAKVEFL